MLLGNVPSGSYEILYDVVITFLKQIPTVFKILTVAPTNVNQIIALVFVILSAKVIITITDVVKNFFVWLNSKL